MRLHHNESFFFSHNTAGSYNVTNPKHEYCFALNFCPLYYQNIVTQMFFFNHFCVTKLVYYSASFNSHCKNHFMVSNFTGFVSCQATDVCAESDPLG